MIRRSLLLVYVLVSAHSVADQNIGKEADIVEMNSGILRETFADGRIKCQFDVETALDSRI